MQLTSFFCEVDEYSVWLLRHWYPHSVILHKGSVDKRIERIRYVLSDLKRARECIIMAKKPSTKPLNPTGTSSSFKSISWVNCNLSDDDISSIENWELSDTELLTALSSLIGEGYAVSVKRSPDNLSVMATIIGQADTCDNVGKGMSAFADTPDDAIKVLLYKHFNLLRGQWGDGSNSRAKFR